jgi:glycosyltransferase involved in cell wall biosynthesis
VLHISMALDRGGAEAVIETLLDGTDRRRYTPVVALPGGSALIARWRAAGWTVHETRSAPRLRDVSGGLAMVRDLEAIVRTQAISVVHTHGTAAQIYGGRAAARAGCPVVWHTHDTFHTAWTWEGVLHRLAAAQRHDVVIAISQVVATTLQGHVSPSQVDVIPNGVCAEPVTPQPRPVAGPWVVWCGRLQRWKGAHLFLEMAALVARTQPTARFVLVGGTLFGMEPDYAPSLRARAEELQIADRVEWAGQVADARPWMAAADVCVHSSVAPEPFGLVIAEAMMQSRPVVAFQQGGPAEMIVDGETGMLVRPGDVSALAQAVSALLADPDRAARLGRAGRTRALSTYTSAAMVARVESAYDRARA